MCCPSTKVIKSDSKVFLAIGGLHEEELCDALQAMAWTNVRTKPPYSISRATSIDSDRCRPPSASVLSNKADKSRSNQFRSTSPSFHGHTSCRNKGNCITEVHGGGDLELVKLPREPASSRPKLCASLKNAPGIFPIRRPLFCPYDSRAKDSALSWLVDDRAALRPRRIVCFFTR